MLMRADGEIGKIFSPGKTVPHYQLGRQSMPLPPPPGSLTFMLVENVFANMVKVAGNY